MAFAVTKAEWSERLLILFALAGIVVVAVCFGSTKPKPATKDPTSQTVIVVPSPEREPRDPRQGAPAAPPEGKLYRLV